MSQSGSAEVVVVTGASAGVGRAVARAFAADGAKVGLLARGEAGLEGARQDVEAAGGEALAVPTDVADPEQVEAAAERVEDELGPIDVWVNNAMTSVFGETWATTADEYRRVTAVTYLGYVHGTKAALDRMRPRDAGTIIQVGSALAYRAIPLQSAYCAAKHAIQGFTESLRSELIHENSGVQVTMVQLPAVNTPQFEWVRNHADRRPQPVPPIYQPEVAADAVVWAARHDRDELWVGAPTVKAIVGNRLVPRRLDRKLAKSGYGSQLTGESADPDRADTLHAPVDDDEDYGARGRFDDRARDRSPLLWATAHRSAVAAAAAVVAGLVTLALATLAGDDQEDAADSRETGTRSRRTAPRQR
jgi:short-subunit dehydrogenase